MEQIEFRVVAEVAQVVAKEFGTPVYLYDQHTMHELADVLLATPAPFGFTGRYAMKACPARAVLQIFSKRGLKIDASSGPEVERALKVGIPPKDIQLTTQELPDNLNELVELGVSFNACSLEQLRSFGSIKPGTELSIRVNPGLGSGQQNRVNTGGVSSSFGIWHEYISEAKEIAKAANLKITSLHSHIGAGTDPEVWVHCAGLTLNIAKELPDVVRVSVGGGFKISRMPGESFTDVTAVGAKVSQAFVEFKNVTGRELHLEIEPGTYLVGNAAALISNVIDVVDTGSKGYRFIKINSGMTEILRPSIYGAQHFIEVFPVTDPAVETGEFIVVGHCCESGDMLTPKPNDPEALQPRTLGVPQLGDLLVVHGAGAYCSSFSTLNYNSFSQAPEVLRLVDGSFKLIRKKQTLDQILTNEIGLDD